MIPSSAWPYRLIAAALILGAALMRVLYLANDCPLDLAPDEAHYWDWSRHLDWSYYSKGPLVAWLIRLSCWLFGPWSVSLIDSEMLAVRMPAVLCGSLLLTGLYVLTVQIFRRESLALVIIVIGLTMPLVAAGSTFMTIDAPYTCLWTWALVVGNRAVFGGSWWAWPVAGLLIGLGILAKYTMVLWLPCLGLFLLATPPFRTVLARPGFWIMTLVAGLCCLPIVLWNAQHDWVTLRHTGGHAGLESDQLIHWLGPLRYLGTQFGILLGFWFIVWVRGAWLHRPGREQRPELLYLWWLSAPVFVFFGLFSLKNGGGEPNWPVTAYLAGFVLAAGCLADELRSASEAQRRWAVGGCIVFAALGLGLTVIMHRIIWLQPVLARIAGPVTPARPVPLRKVDPTARLRGWRTLAAEVDALRHELRGLGIEPEIAGASWIYPGELGFYCAEQPAVYNIGPALGDRQSQYDLWRPNPVADPEHFRGKTFIIVGARAEMLAEAFERVEPARTVVHEEQGHLVNRWIVTVGHGYHGFPPRDKMTTY
jgi:hypothetical protein